MHESYRARYSRTMTWDRSSPGYLADWLPQLAPYEADLAAELGLHEGARVRCTAGPEAIALARAVGESGRVVAIAPTDEMLALCKERAAAAAVGDRVTCARACTEGGFDAAVSAFELDGLEALRDAIGPRGKVGVMIWGPAADDDPERVFARAVDEAAPDLRASAPLAPTDRESLSRAFEAAGLVVVRHTVVSHAMIFPRAERFAAALLGARTYGAALRARGQAAVAAALARFYERSGGQDEPVTYEPAATLVVAALPGAEIELPHRPSVRVPV